MMRKNQQASFAMLVEAVVKQKATRLYFFYQNIAVFLELGYFFQVPKVTVVLPPPSKQVWLRLLDHSR